MNFCSLIHSFHLTRRWNNIQQAPFTFNPTAAVFASKVKPRVRLYEKDLQERFIHGRGPGGQKTNKTSNAVELVHLPSGIRVVCHDTRSQHINRKIARTRLADLVDQHLNGKESRLSQQDALDHKRKSRSEKRSREKYQQLEKSKTKPAIEDEKLLFHLQALSLDKEEKDK